MVRSRVGGSIFAFKTCFEHYVKAWWRARCSRLWLVLVHLGPGLVVWGGASHDGSAGRSIGFA